MHYHVSRGGQVYGPYTLADLERYVGSGHILATDLAKSEEMADWAPVGQILNPTPAQEIPAPPAASYAPQQTFSQQTYSPQQTYGQPTPYVPAYAPAGLYPDPPNLHWALVLLIDFFTCGLFQMIWNLVIAAWLRRVEPASKALFYYIGGYALLLIYGGSVYPAFLGAMHHSVFRMHLGLRLLGLIAWVLRLVARYSVKASLEQHFNGPEPIGYTMNPVLLFFFGGLYIQSELNRINEIRQGIRYRDAAGR